MAASRFTKDQRMTLLKGVGLISNCTREELRRISSLTTSASVDKGTVLTLQGQPGNEVFIVVSGTAIAVHNERELAQQGPDRSSVSWHSSTAEAAPRPCTPPPTWSSSSCPGAGSGPSRKRRPPWHSRSSTSSAAARAGLTRSSTNTSRPGRRSPCPPPGRSEPERSAGRATDAGTPQAHGLAVDPGRRRTGPSSESPPAFSGTAPERLWSWQIS